MGQGALGGMPLFTTREPNEGCVRTHTISALKEIGDHMSENLMEEHIDNTDTGGIKSIEQMTKSDTNSAYDDIVGTGFDFKDDEELKTIGTVHPMICS